MDRTCTLSGNSIATQEAFNLYSSGADFQSDSKCFNLHSLRISEFLKCQNGSNIPLYLRLLHYSNSVFN